MCMVFQDDDAGYLQWLDNHTCGHVLNIAATGNYHRLHKSKCRENRRLSHNAGGDNPRTTSYIKVCADTEDELVSWALTNRQIPSVKRCGRCPVGAGRLLRPSGRGTLMSEDVEIEFETPLEEEVESIDIPAQTRTVYTDGADPEVSSLHGKAKRGKLVVQPDFQRHFV
jgi:hypothetical protein